MSTTTAPQTERPSPWTRAVLGLILGSLATLGCDHPDPSEACLPEDGCDGVAAVEEETTLAAIPVHQAGPVAAHPGQATPQGSGAPRTPVGGTDIALPPPVPTDHPEIPEAACLVHPDDAADWTVIAHDPEVCATISVHCLPDWVNLDPECGCGCRYVGDESDDRDPA